VIGRFGIKEHKKVKDVIGLSAELQLVDTAGWDT
jgi:hypothetical protein